MNTVRTRNIDPEVARLRATLGPLERDGRGEEAVQVRLELRDAKILAACRKLGAQIATELSPEKADIARAILAGA